jgi:AAA family ATP:ADP antiporter
MFKSIFKATNIQRHELPAVLASFFFVLALMVAYYLLRPIRDSMASDWTDAEVSWLWTLNFFISTLMTAIYGYFVSRVNFQKIVPGAYFFFAFSFLFFYLLVDESQNTALVDQTFYVWLSVFALFHVSIFWSVMADTYNQEQAKRLFSVIAAGASVGAIIGPLLSSLMVNQFGLYQTMLVSAGLLLLPIPLNQYLQKIKYSALGNAGHQHTPESPIGGMALSGFKTFLSSRYLLGIGFFIILYTGIGSFVYFELKNLLVDYSREERVMIYGYRDALTNTITLLLAFFVTSRLVNRLGMPTALSLAGIIIALGMLWLAALPMLTVALGIWVVRSAGNYGLTRPAREMLFTRVSREDRFKAKPVIDIVAYRGGDVIMAWLFTLLTQGLGLGLGIVAIVGGVIALLWAITGFFLGRIFEKENIHLNHSESEKSYDQN